MFQDIQSDIKLSMECEIMKNLWIPGLLVMLVTGLLLVSGCTTNAPSTQTVEPTNHGKIPNLTGTWNIESQCGVIQKSSVPGQWTHQKGLYDTLSAQAVITDQNNRVMHGTLNASPGANESFIAVIGMDNKSWHYVDFDGSSVGQIVNNDLINVIYTQITANESVIAMSTWTRVK